MKMTIRRKVKCTGCLRYESPIGNKEIQDCVQPVPSYIPQEQRMRWMKVYHEKMIRCIHHMTWETMSKELLNGN